MPEFIASVRAVFDGDCILMNLAVVQDDNTRRKCARGVELALERITLEEPRIGAVLTCMISHRSGLYPKDINNREIVRKLMVDSTFENAFHAVYFSIVTVLNDSCALSKGGLKAHEQTLLFATMHEALIDIWENDEALGVALLLALEDRDYHPPV